MYQNILWNIANKQTTVTMTRRRRLLRSKEESSILQISLVILGSSLCMYIFTWHVYKSCCVSSFLSIGICGTNENDFDELAPKLCSLHAKHQYECHFLILSACMSWAELCRKSHLTSTCVYDSSFFSLWKPSSSPRWSSSWSLPENHMKSTSNVFLFTVNFVNALLFDVWVGCMI